MAGFVAHHGGVAHDVAAGILAPKLSFAVVLFRPRLAPVFLVGAVALHAGTWITLGLDYWAHLAVVTIILVEWDRIAVPALYDQRRPA